MIILEQVRLALDILTKNGYFAYVVGGCVRDSLLFYTSDNYILQDKAARPPKDWDVTTSALPEQILDCFHDYRVIETGLKYGTITVIIDKLPIEITTYRIDGDYTDNRHPSGVSFTDNLKDDLSRRDFTMNAIAYNIEVIDYFGGTDDIRNKIIRTVGDPDKRFSEDALRILRGIRFAAQLNFKIEENTKNSIIKNKDLIKNISDERINAELTKLILGKNFYNALSEYKEVIPFSYELSETLKNSEEDLILRLSILLWDTENPRSVLKGLKFDNYTIDNVIKITENKNTKIIMEKQELKKLLNKLSEPILRYLLKIKNQSEAILDEIIENGECYLLKDLKIDGNDIRDSGITAGKKIGEILNEVLMLVIEEKLENNKEACSNYIKNEYNDYML